MNKIQRFFLPFFLDKKYKTSFSRFVLLKNKIQISPLSSVPQSTSAPQSSPSFFCQSSWPLPHSSLSAYHQYYSPSAQQYMQLHEDTSRRSQFLAISHHKLRDRRCLPPTPP